MLLAFALATAVTGYYLLYVAQVRDYLISRNVRLLSAIAAQLERTIESDRDVLTNLRFEGDNERPKKDIIAEKEQASNFIPLLRTADVHEKAELADKKPNLALQFTERRSLTKWDVYGDSSSPRQGALYFEVRLWELVRPLLRDRANGETFDVLLVAARDGRVLFQTPGPVRIFNIDQLTDSAAAGQDSKTSGQNSAAAGKRFSALARSSGLVDVVLSGTEYKLFTQPCCTTVTEHGKEDSVGWVLCGLTAKERLTAASLPVPFTLLGILFLLLLLAVLSWPFVKLSLIGDTQRVSAYDAALVGICGLLGSALITVLVLDLFGATVLQGTLDWQLKQLAKDIRERANQEIQAASAQLARLDAAVAAGRLPAGAKVRDLAGPSSEEHPYVATEELQDYPFFQSFSLIGANGRQQQKMSLGSFVTPLVSVARRAYFRQWKAGHWEAGQYPPPVLEPVQSLTTGGQEVVISTALGDDEFQGGQPGDPDALPYRAGRRRGVRLHHHR